MHWNIIGACGPIGNRDKKFAILLPRTFSQTQKKIINNLHLYNLKHVLSGPVLSVRACKNGTKTSSNPFQTKIERPGKFAGSQSCLVKTTKKFDVSKAKKTFTVKGS